MRNFLRRLFGPVSDMVPVPPAEVETPPIGDPPMERWDEAKFAVIEDRLKTLPEDAWTPEDHYLSLIHI